MFAEHLYTARWLFFRVTFNIPAWTTLDFDSVFATRLRRVFKYLSNTRFGDTFIILILLTCACAKQINFFSNSSPQTIFFYIRSSNTYRSSEWSLPSRVVRYTIVKNRNESTDIIGIITPYTSSQVYDFLPFFLKKKLQTLFYQSSYFVQVKEIEMLLQTLPSRY